MTITAAWVRTIKDCRELIVVSDSRLNGGKKMDCGQKVHILPRSDAFICFAGDTSWAYPLMHQVITSISTYERSASRAQDIVELKSHILKVFQSLRDLVHDACGDEDTPAAEFLFGGYSWIRKKFMIWRIHFVKGMNSFEAAPVKTWGGNPWVFAGDKQHVDQAKIKLTEIMRANGRMPNQVDQFKFNWEPFEVIRDMLRMVDKNAYLHKHDSIGGAPQVLKIYEHLNAKYFAIDWTINNLKDGKGVYLCGRKILDYETPELWILDPDTLSTRHPQAHKDENQNIPDEPLEEESYELI